MKKLLVFIFLYPLVLSADMSKSTPLAKYAEKVEFEIRSIVRYPDFELQFLGKRVPPRSARQVQLGDIYDFQISSSGILQRVEWSSGTGDIAARSFKASGACFSLELGISGHYGALADNTLVITRMEDKAFCER